MRENLKDFSVSNSEKRKEYIINFLEKNSVEYKITSDKKKSYTNIIVNLGEIDIDNKVVVIGAHYDVFPGSLGINDNGCAVITLLRFIGDNKDKLFTEPLEIVFFDKEESGMIGSYNYVKENKKRIKYSIILDIIGFGDQLVYGSHYQIFDELFKDFGVEKIQEVLPSDNLSFRTFDVPSTLIVAVPKKDLEINENHLFSLIAFPEFYSSFHNGRNDNNLNKINFDLMEKTIEILNSLFVGNKIRKQ